ncbi:MAG: hypothetical protein NC548_64015 [Lachnospiraceae bacterium]|nr:hypothetical protein [Lachnospiraceae bacterium]
MKKKILFSLLAALVLSFTATAQVVIGSKIIGAKKSSVKSIIVVEDEFTGSKVYQSNDSSTLQLDGGNFLELTILPSFAVRDDSSSIMLQVHYQIGTNEDSFFEKILLIGGGKKVALEFDTSKMTSSVSKLKVGIGFINLYVHKCKGTISKEEYDILKEVLANGDLKFAAYSTTNKSLPTSQGKPKGKKHMTLFSDLETAALADNPEVVFAENDGVIKISAQ